ncbi:MAG: hypothetical protein ABFS03_04690 [Chloroflexota bacterium]
MPLNWNLTPLQWVLFFIVYTAFFGWSGWWIARTLRLSEDIGLAVGLGIWIAVIYFSTPLQNLILYAIRNCC